jgi:imidazoleglycerol phosphate synthase glutamine amidotransferase subunit HisH
MLQMSAEPKLDSRGGVVGAVCVGEDVLARRRVEEKQRMMLQLERENQLKVQATQRPCYFVGWTFVLPLARMRLHDC